MQRIGWVARLKPDKANEYIKLHADVWPGVLEMIKQCHIRNYSIFVKTLPSGEKLLFSYLEYTGDDFEADMRKMAAHEETQRWWKVCHPCLEPVEELPDGQVWAPMDSIFHLT
ncbi:MAG TPA: L-rhamnose mutarotase [Planctomycetaceae bacterium]|nr:L-rhamnose mutarotase [Planctomycetaceae bacterium]